MKKKSTTTLGPQSVFSPTPAGYPIIATQTPADASSPSHQCFLLEIYLPHPARRQDTCSPYGSHFEAVGPRIGYKCYGSGPCFSDSLCCFL